jgi:c-di-GMP-binding flagellar brake protein YcgR
MMNESDRRQYVRLEKPFTVSIKLFDFPPSEEVVEAVCRNISAGGMLLESPRGVLQGSMVKATIHIPKLNKFHPGFFKVFENDFDQNLVALAEVIRSHELSGEVHELGLKFVDVYEDDWKALHNLIMANLA